MRNRDFRLKNQNLENVDLAHPQQAFASDPESAGSIASL
jgi:hypothetical protein